MFKVVGKSVNKVDGLSHATGTSQFTDDIYIRGILHGKILKSPHPHGRIKHIDTSKAEALDGVKAVLTYKDFPRIPHTTAGQGYPEPSPYDTFLLDNKVRYVGDKVALVAAETLEIAEKALSLIEVDYEILPAVFDPREARKDGSPVIHDEPDAYMPVPLPYEPEKNIAARVDIKIGDVEKGLKDADYVIDRTYYAHRGQHCSTEPHITITCLDEKNRLVIRTSTQVPFHVRRIVARILGLPVKRVRVIKPRIGGGFGGKQEIILEPLCGALTLKTGRPVRIQCTREEEFIFCRSRHPQYNYLRAGVRKDGTITAIDMKILNDTGAYGSHSLTVMCNGGNKALPLYRCENVNFYGEAVYTNNPVAGAYRGYGVPQTVFAMEVHIDEMAEKIGMDPLEFRKKNHIKLGETSPVFKALGEGKAGNEQFIESCGLEECLEIGSKEIQWNEKRNSHNTSRPHIKRGVGMACLLQGSGIPECDMASATMKMNEDGSFNLLAGATDLGTGSDTVLSQIAAEVLSVSVDDIIIYSSDTDMTPFDVGAYASSTTFVSGGAVKKAAEGIKEQILKVAGQMLKVAPDKLECEDGKVIYPEDGRSVTYSQVACDSLYSNNQFQIAYTASNVKSVSPPPFTAHFAEVEVDTETGIVKVLKYVAVLDCGTPINPKLVEGQTEGGILNGISYALTEEYKFNNNGKILNPNLGDYKIYTMGDLPEIIPVIVRTYEPSGPFGAKSAAEVPICAVLPAISNAIYNATGLRLTEGPFTPEKVLKGLGKI